ncbi:MAG: hypothetical protein QXP91_05570 [Candidatus Methanomethylicia archaeon]
MYIVELFSTRLPKILRAAWIQHCLMEHNPLLLPAIMNTLAYRNSITHVFSYSSLDGVYYSRFGLIRYLCKDCWFNDQTETALHYSRPSLRE